LKVRRLGKMEEKKQRKEGRGTPPPVFFVRVASKGLMLDAARKSGKYKT
jgi:hypothetical protein